MQMRDVAISSLAFMLFFSMSCASKPRPAKFSGKWQFCEIIPGEGMACLSKDDVKRLREVLIRCGGDEN